MDFSKGNLALHKDVLTASTEALSIEWPDISQKIKKPSEIPHQVANMVSPGKAYGVRGLVYAAYKDSIRIGGSALRELPPDERQDFIESTRLGNALVYFARQRNAATMVNPFTIVHARQIARGKREISGADRQDIGCPYSGKPIFMKAGRHALRLYAEAIEAN